MLLDFSRNYYIKNKKWPASVHNRVKTDYTKNMWTETSACPYNLDHFEHVSFDLTLDFIYDLKTSDLLNDKAVIPRVEEWVYEYDLAAYKAIHHRSSPRPLRGTKRAILNFLKKDSLDIRSAVEAVHQRRVSPHDKVMVAFPKEREFKREDARFL